MVNSEEKAENNLRKWFKDNFINSRSLKHACSIHRWAYVLQLQGKIIENLFCYMIFSTYTVILIKCYILMSVLVIFHCYTTNLLLLICPDCPSMLYSYVRACQILRNVEKMGLRVTSCEDDTLLLRRCLAASFFLKLAMKQPDGEYRYGVETVYALYPLSAELNDDMKEKNATL